jgi:hypothetical protein
MSGGAKTMNNGKMIALCDALFVAKEGGEAGRPKDKEQKAEERGTHKTRVCGLCF